MTPTGRTDYDTASARDASFVTLRVAIGILHCIWRGCDCAVTLIM